MFAFLLTLFLVSFVLACGLFGFLVYKIEKEQAQFRAYMKERYG